MKFAPLSSGFMLVAMLGFMLSIIYTSFGRVDPSWGVAFGIVFAVMFIASMISMTKTPIEVQEEVDKKLFETKYKPRRSTSGSATKKKRKR